MARYSFHEEVDITLRMLGLMEIVGICGSSIREFSQTESSQIIKPCLRPADSYQHQTYELCCYGLLKEEEDRVTRTPDLEGVS
jgi:hypothetical protein